MPELEELVRRQIVERLQNDTALLAKTRHREMKAVIRFDLAVSVRDAGHKAGDPTPMTRQMFATVADFFRDPLAEGAGLDLHVLLFWDSGESKHRVWNLGWEPEPDELVFVEVQEPVLRQYYRADRSYAEKLESDIVPIRRVPIGYYVSTNQEPLQAQDLRLHEVKAWDFGDYLIGDPSHGKEVAMVKSAKLLQQMHQAALREVEATNAGTGQQYGFEGGRKVKIDAVVRLVSHLDVGYGPKQGDDLGTEAWLPSSVQVEFEAFEGEQTIISHLKSELKGHLLSRNLGDAEHDAISRLFVELEGDKFAVNGWKMLLFVLPQGGKKLHSFPSKGPGTVERLWEYVDPKKIRTDKDGLERSFLYMEAHIVKESPEAKVVPDNVTKN